MSYGSSPNEKQIEHFDSIIGNVQKVLARRDIYRLELTKLGSAVDDMIDTDDTGIIYATMPSGIFKMTCDLLRAVPAAVDSNNFEALFSAAMVIIEQITIYHEGALLFKTRSDLVLKSDLVGGHATIKKGLAYLRSISLFLNIRNEHAIDNEFQRSGLKITTEGAEKLTNTEASRAVDREMTARNQRDADDQDEPEGDQDDPA